MRLTTKVAYATVQRRVYIEDGPIIKADGYTRRYRVDTVTILYTWTDSQFKVAHSFDVKLAGHWVKKDGSNAADRATDMRVDRVDYTSSNWTEQYQFLLPIIETLRPAPNLDMTTLHRWNPEDDA